jgi:short-subunit dehydrogenase
MNSASMPGRTSSTRTCGASSTAAANLPPLASGGGGHLVNVASAAGLLCPPEMAGYNVAKAGVVALSETLRVELAPDNMAD